jgi:RimJ/RimL family protein N-acetyltransferase
MLRSERVLLRPMRQDDVIRQHEFNQDIELYGLDSDEPHVSPLERAQAFYNSRTQDETNRVVFAIEVDGQYIGNCGLKGLNNRHGNAELGIMIGDRDYWGRGYGREAINLLLHYAFHYLGVRRIELTTHAKNERAIRCYLACGFVEEGRPRKVVWIEGEYVDLVNMGLLREEWTPVPIVIDSRDS